MKKNSYQNKLKYCLILIVLFCTYFFLCAESYTNAVSANVSNSVFRLHILANSDSEEDQNLKLLVRDGILEYTNTLIDASMSKDEVISILKDNEGTLYDIAYTIIKDNGFDYSVNISFGKNYFPTKNYGDISLPAGYYDGLRIEIGEAERS